MMRWEAEGFISAMSELSRAAAYVSLGDEPEQSLRIAESALKRLHDELEKIPFSHVAREQLRRMRAHVERTTDMVRVRDLGPLLIDLHGTMRTALGEHTYLLLQSPTRWMYLNPTSWYGAETVEAFPDARLDFDEACRSYVLGRHTAAVFHAMRVLEHGLRALARALDVEAPAGIELKTWGWMIGRIEKRIRQMEEEAASLARSERLQFLSEAASHFFYFKEAWRNHVSHSRKSYEYLDAKNVLDHIKYFMAHLVAGGLSGAGTAPSGEGSTKD
jgi:HEPN domain-containing protein